MQIMITDLSLYAKTILEQHSSWTVHSVYRKTINLQSGDLLLALQTAGSPLSPISLITDLSEAGMDAQKTVPGMEIPSSALQTDQANVRDLDEIPDYVKNGIRFPLLRQFRGIVRRHPSGDLPGR